MNRKIDKTQLDGSSINTDKCFLPSSLTNKGATDAYEIIEINRGNQFMTKYDMITF